MEKLCAICSNPLSESEIKAGYVICYNCRFEESDDEIRVVRRCEVCGKPIRFGRCWSCASKDDGKPCDPELLKSAN